MPGSTCAQPPTYLASHARAGQTVLANNAWPFTQRLYEAGKIDSPWQVYDAYRLDHGELHSSVCRADWFVVAQGAATLACSSVRRRIAACHSFRRVYRERSPVTSIGSEFNFVTWDARVAIYRNVRRDGTG